MLFQENLLKTMIQIEDTINETAKHYHTEKDQNCLIIYDRGCMDATACKLYFYLNTYVKVLNCILNQDLNQNDWEILKTKNSTWNEVDLRDNRYDQIIHMVSICNLDI